MKELRNLAQYRRYVSVSSNLLVVRGTIAPVIAGMQAYNARYKIKSPPRSLDPLVNELLAGAALAAVSLSDRESWGWSLTFKGMDAGFFIGAEPEGMICLKILPADSENASGMVQRQKAGFPMTQSHLEPRTSGAIPVVEQYFSEVVQIRTRLVLGKDGEGALVQALPGGNFDAIKDLDADRIFDFIDTESAAGNLKDAGEVLVFYECRCSEEMISKLVENLEESDREHLFGESPEIAMECPRCGREYTVRRTYRTVH